MRAGQLGQLRILVARMPSTATPRMKSSLETAFFGLIGVHGRAPKSASSGHAIPVKMSHPPMMSMPLDRTRPRFGYGPAPNQRRKLF